MMREQPGGLRLKFNLVLVPIIALSLAVLLWADYQHEFSSLMDAHAGHSVAVGSTEERPRPPDANLPNDTAARSLKMHVLLGGLIITLLVGAVNVTLQAFVLGPIRAMRSHVVDLEHGRWRGQQPPASNDEVGTLHADFHRLGPELDALMTQSLRAERLSVIALVSRRLSREIDPEVSTLGRTAAELVDVHPEAANAVARATATIVRAVRQLDAPFVSR